MRDLCVVLGVLYGLLMLGWVYGEDGRPIAIPSLRAERELEEQRLKETAKRSEMPRRPDDWEDFNEAQRHEWTRDAERRWREQAQREGRWPGITGELGRRNANRRQTSVWHEGETKKREAERLSSRDALKPDSGRPVMDEAEMQRRDSELRREAENRRREAAARRWAVDEPRSDASRAAEEAEAQRFEAAQRREAEIRRQLEARRRQAPDVRQQQLEAQELEAHRQAEREAEAMRRESEVERR